MRTLRWTWPLLAVALLILTPWACYACRPTRSIDAVFVDKTVPYTNRLEHRSLFWLVDHLKLRRTDGRPYDRDVDYLGAFPGPRAGDPPARTTELTRAAALSGELIYLIDTYGVYEEDLASGEAMRAALERSPRIYGGLGVDESLAAVEALSNGATLVAEFNTFASPTAAAPRALMERALGVHWTRWIGRYFARLDDESEVPRWLVRNYEREWQRRWEFTGAGYVLLQDDDHVEVLLQGRHAEAVALVIERERPVDPLLQHALDGTPYPYWFDIVEIDAGSGARVLASFEWRLTAEGRGRLAQRGLPLRFPAVVRRMAPGGGTALYFAGDFADNPMSDGPVPFAGYPTLRRLLESFKLAPAETSFYWRFYVPMMTALFEQVSRSEGD